MAYEGLCDGRGGGKAALGEVGLVLAHYREDHLPAGIEVLDLDGGKNLDLVRAELALVDDFGVCYGVLEFSNLELQEPLCLTGRFVFRIFRKVALLTGFLDDLGYLLAADGLVADDLDGDGSPASSWRFLLSSSISSRIFR